MWVLWRSRPPRARNTFDGEIAHLVRDRVVDLETGLSFASMTGQDLDRDGAVEAHVLRSTHLAHAASADVRLD